MSAWSGFEHHPLVKKAMGKEGLRPLPNAPLKKHKFGAVREGVDNLKFPSKLEARYYKHLKTLRDSGDIRMFLMQVPMHLDGGTIYRLDFLVFWSNGDITFEDTKGRETEGFLIKKREIEQKYGIEIKVIGSGQF